MTDEQRPWREWPEYERAFPALAAYDALDALCARVWREAQVDAAKQDSPALRMSLESHLKHVESRADAAEAQRDRLAAALEDCSEALGFAKTFIAGTLTNTYETNACFRRMVASQNFARAALADAPRHEGGHSVPAAESTADTDTLPDSTNATIMPGEGESYADSTLSGKPIMPTLTDEEHAAVERTLSRTHEARQARKRDEAYRAMRDALVLVTQDGRHNSTMVWEAIDRALALAREVEET